MWTEWQKKKGIFNTDLYTVTKLILHDIYLIPHLYLLTAVDLFYCQTVGVWNLSLFLPGYFEIERRMF